MKDLTDLRQDYTQSELSKATAPLKPELLFAQWFEEAKQAEPHEAYTMSLATSSNNKPSVRIVLLRAFSEQGLEFYTNYQSHKGHDLELNPHAEALFFWPSLERQVRVFGFVEKLSSEASSAYFAKRPKGSQLAALVSSPQSAKVESRGVIEQRYAELEARYKEQEVPKPEQWGGYLIVPESYEFWQGRASRMHDRLSYQRSDDSWSLSRLLP